MFLKTLTVAAAVVAVAFFPVAGEAAGDPARGRDKTEVCVPCHGPTGNSERPETPSLAGQPADFVEMQLILFREGVRKVEVMREFARGLSDKDIEDIAASYAAQAMTPRPGDRRDRDFRRGGELSRGMYCGQCHARQYLGGGQVPRLAGQREDYLLHALRDYQGNTRVGFDTNMNGVVHGLSEADLAALAHYFAQQ